MTTEAPRCATCKHWDPPDTNIVYAHTYGICAAINGDSFDETPPTHAIVDTTGDPRCLSAAFVACVADFGCTLHEPRPPTEETT